MEFVMDVAGAAETQAALDSLPKVVHRKVIRAACRAAAKLVNAAAKANARSMVGGTMGRTIARAIRTRAYKRQRPNEYAVHISIADKYNETFAVDSATGRRSYIPFAIEYGHAAPGRAGGPKTSAAIPYIRRAYHATKAAAIRAAERSIATGLDAAVAAAAAKARARAA